MIIGFVGTPGSGKSYEAIKKIIDNLKLGRVVLTNIHGLDEPKHREAIKSIADLSDLQIYDQLHSITDDECREFWKYVTPGCIVVIDEVHKLFSNRNWQSPENQQFAEWASTHRHYLCDVILITQDIGKVDKHAKSLIEWTYFFRKVNQFGGLVTKKYKCYSYEGDEHTGEPLATATRTYDPKIFKCYKSYTVPNLVEMPVMKHVNILKHPVFYAIPIVFLIFCYFVSKSSLFTGDIFGVKKATEAGLSSLNKNSNVVGPVVPVKTDVVKEVPKETKEMKKEEIKQVVKTEEFEKKTEDKGSDKISKHYLSNHTILYSNVENVYLPRGVSIVGSVPLENK